MGLLMELLLQRAEVADRSLETIVLEHHGGVACERLEKLDVLRTVARRLCLATANEEQPIDTGLAAQRNRDRPQQTEIGHEAVEAVGDVSPDDLSWSVPFDLRTKARVPITAKSARPEWRDSLRAG